MYFEVQVFKRTHTKTCVSLLVVPCVPPHIYPFLSSYFSFLTAKYHTHRQEDGNDHPDGEETEEQVKKKDFLSHILQVPACTAQTVLLLAS